ncbi:MAG TPA: GGDEF domain-containing protein [Pilimelia sp.]|nr:GGDEF domain-containing protein [Pilimelia sp.]
MRMVAAAQQGAAEEVRRAAEARMVELSGSLEAGPAGLHFVRAVAFRAAGDIRAALAASALMLSAAEREGDAGWRSTALSFRAGRRIMLGDGDLAEYDIDAVLRDLTAAEVALAVGVADLSLAAAAHIGIGIGYNLLRLYELAQPHYTAAYELGLQYGDPENAIPAICQANLAEMHLEWALELYRVGEVAEAEKHSLIAESHALQAGRDASPSNTYRRDAAALYAGCARADGDDPAGAAAQINMYAERIRAYQRMDVWLFAMPFLAVALSRSGRHDEGLAVIEQAMAELPSDGEWLTAAALTHTHAVLLAKTGPPELQAVLRYGDGLAGALWRQRQRTLNSAETLRSYQKLRAEHEQVSRSANTDALTGVPNRRAFDRELARRASATGAGDGTNAVLVIDLDGLKPLNDRLGHAVGDQTLQTVAAALASEVRGRDLLARTGGDEFCALIDGANTHDATQIAERMVHAVRDLDLAITVSIGIAAGPSMAIQDTLHRADQAMYAAKGAGGNQASAAPSPA